MSSLLWNSYLGSSIELQPRYVGELGQVRKLIHVGISYVDNQELSLEGVQSVPFSLGWNKINFIDRNVSLAN